MPSLLKHTAPARHSSPVGTISFTSGSPRNGDPELAAATDFVDTVVAEPVAGQNLLRVDQNLALNSSARLTLAYVDRELAGCVATFLDHGSSHGWLVSLAVAPAFRGRGIAGRLVRSALEDRRDVDGGDAPLLAAVRILPDGQLNWASYAALRRSGFVATRFLRPRITSFGDRGAHLYAMAEADDTVRQLLTVHVTKLKLARAW